MKGKGSSGPPEEPRAPGGAGGWREDQIAAEDLAALKAQCVLRRIEPRMSAAVHVLDQRRIDMGPQAPRPLRLKVAPLPKKARVRRVRQEPPAIVVRRDLALALRQPVRRRRLLMGELKPAQEKALYRKLYEKYGEAARALNVEAVFAQVPPEAAGSVRLDPELRSLHFVLPPDVSPRGAQEGYYLVALRDALGQTRKVLFRL